MGKASNDIIDTNNGSVRFGIYTHLVVINKTGEIAERYLIVLKKGNRIINWTDFHKYIRSSKTKLSHQLNENNKQRTKNIVKLLNYVFFEKYHIHKLEDINIQMVQRYLNEYGMCNLPNDDDLTHRKQSTVDVCITHIIDFLVEFIRDKNSGCKFKEKELYRVEKVWSKHRMTFVERKVPTFTINTANEYDDKIFRDIPTDAFAIIMNNIYFNHPRILMLAANSAFAGCRPSESCNIRREDSKLGPGIMIEYIDDKVENITLDLRYELNLRSDGVVVGRIKKHRLQKVYHGLMSNWIECYNRYNKFNEGRKYEAEYGPLTTNNVGMAMTYQTYYDEFRSAVKEVIPEMLADDNPEVVFYGNLLATHRISPHILRHWFTVYLVLNGAELNDLMYWRGDRTPESSEVYLNNKSDIVKKHNQVAEEAFDFLYWRAAK